MPRMLIVIEVLSLSPSVSVTVRVMMYWPSEA